MLIQDKVTKFSIKAFESFQKNRIFATFKSSKRYDAADFMVGVFCANTLFTTKVLTKYRAVSWSRNAHGAFALKSLNST